MSTLPPGVKLTAGARIPTSQRGYFVHFPDGSIHYVACRFAGLAQVLARTGIQGSLARQKPAPGQPDNFVHQLQIAGDPTTKTGSTLGMAQAAVRKLVPDAKVAFGTMTAAEIHEALGKGATISIGLDCAKLPAKLKNFVGRNYAGGHICTLDDVTPGALGGPPIVAMTDPMYAPAKNIHSRWVDWTDIEPAMSRRASTGEYVVTVGYQDASNAPKPPSDTAAQLAQVTAERDQAIKERDQARLEAAATETLLEQAQIDLGAAEDRAAAGINLSRAIEGALDDYRTSVPDEEGS